MSCVNYYPTAFAYASFPCWFLIHQIWHCGMKFPFFYLSHYGLWTITPYYAFSGRFSTHRDKGKNETWLNCATSWLLFCSGVTGLFSFNFVSILLKWSGQNLNYMTSPLPMLEDVLDGTDCRILSALLIFILFIVTQINGIGLELFYITIFPFCK